MVGPLALRLIRAEILPGGWTYRRALSFKAAVSDAPGENLAWAEFYANGTQKGDGSDIRVSMGSGAIVPCRVMQVSGENDLIRIAFVTHGDGPYYVWWGNPQAEKPTGELEVKRGVFVDVFRSGGGMARDENGIEGMFDRGTHVGSVFVPQIFLAYNPLGEERGAMLHYTAQFRIDTAINPEFAFTVQDAGVLKIDGNVVQSQFRGGLRGRARESETVDLAAGWHSIDVTQVNQGSANTGVVVAWRRPGEKGFNTMPAGIFAPVATATAGPLEKVGAGGGGYAADFSVSPEAEAFVPPEAFVPRYVFEAQMPESFGNAGIAWDFGDGQTASGLKKVNHYFLSPGTYAVTLTVKQGFSAEGGANGFTTTRRILVQNRMYARFPRPPQDGDKTVRAVLRDYDLKKLSAANALTGMLFFKDQDDGDEQVAWGRAWLESKDAPASDKTLFDETFDLGWLLEARKDYRAAAEMFRLASIKQTGVLTRLDLMRYQVMTLCDYVDDADGALAVARDWQTKINDASTEQLRRVQGAMLYAAIAKGDSKLAQATVADIGTLKGSAYNDAEIRQGVLARNIEAYIQSRDYDTALQLIDQWELEFPSAIWDGFTRTLWVKLLAAEGRPMIAARVALAHAKANASGFYAAELLYRAAENFKDAGEETQAKAAMDLLTSKYPESPYARGAGKTE